MIELSIDHPVPELIVAEDASTLRAIDEGITQVDSGQGIPLEEMRRELARGHEFTVHQGRLKRNLPRG